MDALPSQSSVNDQQSIPPNARKFEVETVPESPTKEENTQQERSVRFNEDESNPGTNINSAKTPEQDEIGQNCLEEIPESPKPPDDTGTIGYSTHEAIPMTVYYRNQGSQESSSGRQRPTLLDLMRKGEKDQENEKVSRI